MRGLDPRIHPLRQEVLRREMDCRVTSAFTRVFDALLPGNDTEFVGAIVHCITGP
jgi:hypothetical protein